MGDPIRPQAAVPPSQAETCRNRRSIRMETACRLIDFAVTRSLVLAAVVALFRGDVTPETVGLIWAVANLLQCRCRRSGPGVAPAQAVERSEGQGCTTGHGAVSTCGCCPSAARGPGSEDLNRHAGSEDPA
jgi:hypothetical protein